MDEKLFTKNSKNLYEYGIIMHVNLKQTCLCTERSALHLNAKLKSKFGEV